MVTNFGSTTAPTGSVLFGGGTFTAQANPPAGGGVFGGSANSPAGVSLFGAQANPFGGTITSAPAANAMQQQLNTVCKAHNPQYSATFVSWNDNARAQGSCFGSNITDARLKGKNGEDFLVVRPSNFNERIGKVRASDIALIGGNGNTNGELAPVTLNDVLQDLGTHGGYAGVPAGTSLASARDTEVGIRFQAVFLPADADGGTAERGTEVFPETYNYQTRSWQDPKNLILLGTSQGTFVQQDGPGKVAQYLHKQQAGEWRNVYLHATETRHGVAMGQIETDAERHAALRAGKAVSTVIGTRSMGVGFNRLMTIQVPLMQQKSAQRFSFGAAPTTSTFGAAPTTGSLFGAAPTTGSTGMFGCAAPTASFGTARAAGGLFGGGCSAAAAPSSFGVASVAQAAPTGGFSFGAAAPATASCFGATAAAASPAAGGLFGAAAAAVPRKADAHAARVSYGSDGGAMR